MYTQTSSHQLVEFLAGISRHDDPDAAIAAAAELAAEEFDAEVGAVVIDGVLATAVGFGGGQGPPPALAHLRAGADVLMPGIGRCHVEMVSWGRDAGRLIVARQAPAFETNERNLLGGMARGLEMSLRMIGAVHTERTLRAEYERQADERLVLLASLERRRKLLEILLDIQRSISHRAALPTVLEAITAGAVVLLQAPAVLVLDDALDTTRPIVASASTSEVNSELVAQAWPPQGSWTGPASSSEAGRSRRLSTSTACPRAPWWRSRATRATSTTGC